VAGAAYLNARGGFSYDARMLTSVVPTVLDLAYHSRIGRMNMFYKLESLATSKSSANRPMLLFEQKKFTYAQAYDIVLRYGNWLKTHLGVQKGDIVALDFHNGDDFVFLTMGLWAVGAKPAYINYNLSGKALIHCIGRANTKLMLIDPTVVSQVGDDVRQEFPNVRFELFSPDVQGQASAMDPIRYTDDLRDPQVSEDMAILIYTSGTTGLPKAAIVSWGKMLVAAAFAARFLRTKTTDIFYTVSILQTNLGRVSTGDPDSLFSHRPCLYITAQPL
jgi:acyl-coenzyme A synthetase/AMP-(fatty) acid ligase